VKTFTGRTSLVQFINTAQQQRLFEVVSGNRHFKLISPAVNFIFHFKTKTMSGKTILPPALCAAFIFLTTINVFAQLKRSFTGKLLTNTPHPVAQKRIGYNRTRICKEV